MHAHLQHAKDPEATAVLRREAGAWLRSKREAAGLSQRDLAAKVGIEYYTFISQLESGRGRVPPDRYEKYAKAVGVASREFAMTMMRYNDPVTFDLIFNSDQKVELLNENNSAMAGLDARLKRLEATLSSKS